MIKKKVIYIHDQEREREAERERGYKHVYMCAGGYLMQYYTHQLLHQHRSRNILCLYTVSENSWNDLPYTHPTLPQHSIWDRVYLSLSGILQIHV